MKAHLHPRHSRPASALAGVGVYSTADIQELFDWWLPPISPMERARLLAHEFRRRMPQIEPLAVVFDNDGTVFGIAPAGAHLYGLSIPAGHTLAQALVIPASRRSFQAALFTLAAKLTSVSSEGDIKEVLAQFRQQVLPNGGRDIAVEGPAVILLPPDAEPATEGDELSAGTSIISQLLATYKDQSCPHIQVRGMHRPPQLREVRRVAEGLIPLLFPGYQGPMPGDSGFESFVCRRVSFLQHSLTRLVRRALGFQRAADTLRIDSREASAQAQAERIVVSFFGHLPSIRRTLEADVRAAKEKDPALSETSPSTIDHHEVPLAYPGIWAIAVYRVAHELLMLGVPYVPRMMTELAHERTGIDIHPAATIGPGFFIDHGTGVVIGQTAVIGEDVTLYQGVTLGALNFPVTVDGEYDRKVKRHPTIGRGSTVFANAAILGDVIVGEYSTIGANVSLRQDVPPQSVVRVPHTLRELSISGKYPNESNGESEDPEPFLPDELRRKPEEYGPSVP